MIRIHFQRSGGFTGLPLTASVDSGSLTAEEEDELRRLVENAGFFDLPGVITSSTPAGDRFSYRLTVELDGREHTVDIDEAAVPTESRPLLEWLRGLARRHLASGH